MENLLIERQALRVPAPDPEVVKLLPTFLRNNSSVLDVGSGDGRHGIYLAKQGHMVTGIENNPEYVAEARQLVRSLGNIATRLEFIEADMLDLPYYEPTFDAVLSTRSLQELDSRQEVHNAVKNMQKVTLRGGHNFITYYVGTADDQAAKPHIAILDPNEINNIYRLSGWEITGSLPPVMLDPHTEDGYTFHRSYQHLIARKPTHKA